MKKIKFIYILFFFAAISSYGLWACTGTTSETTSKDEPIEKTALDSLPVTAEIDSNFYIKVNLEGQEHTFNFLTLDKAEGNNILTPNLFRIKRCEDVSCINSFYLQAHNFDFNQTPPFTLKENLEIERKQKIIFSFITMTKEAKQFKKLKSEDIKDIKITINKIDGDIYEGDFSGKVTASDSLSTFKGSFRSKMIIQKPIG